MTVEELLAALQAIVDEAQAAGGEDAPLSEEQIARYEELDAQLQTRRKSDELLKRNAAYSTVVTKPLQNRAKLKDDDTLERAFEAYLRTGQKNADIVELRAQGVGTDSTGGYTVPETLRDKIVDRLKSFGGLASAVEEITTASGEPLRWVTLDDTSNTGVIAAEGTAPASGGADLVFGEKSLGAFKYTAPGAGQLPLRVSVELLQDSAFDIEALVTRKLGERIHRKQAVDWVTGGGTTEPFGIDTGTAAAAFTGAALTYADLLAAKHSVDPEYRLNAKWSFNDATLAQIEGLVDGNGRPLLNTYTDGIATGPDNQTLLGYPIVIDQAWQTYADGTANRWGVFGDLHAGYIIRRVKDLTLIVDPYTRVNEGQIQYTLWARADGTVQDPNAFRVLINAV